MASILPQQQMMGAPSAEAGAAPKFLEGVHQMQMPNMRLVKHPKKWNATFENTMGGPCCFACCCPCLAVKTISDQLGHENAITCCCLSCIGSQMGSFVMAPCLSQWKTQLGEKMQVQEPNSCPKDCLCFSCCWGCEIAAVGKTVTEAKTGRKM